MPDADRPMEYMHLRPLAEFKLLELDGDAGVQPGTVTGRLAVYGNIDENDDQLMPGAFTRSLAEWRAQGTMPPMYLNHAGIPFGMVTFDSLLPIGAWDEITEDAKDSRGNNCSIHAPKR
jgi:uncharacterized protein